MSTANPHQVLRSYRRDDSVVDRKVNASTVRRILGYARPYRLYVVGLIISLVLDSATVVAQPLLFRRIIDLGVTPGDRQVVTTCALLIAGLAVLDAGITLISRWFSSRIGEGLIYNLRTEVFDHVQRMPVAFFTRTQTGALVSRLNSDVIGAQQAFTSTLSGVIGNFITLLFVVTAMLALSWQITLASLILLPVFLIPARYMGRTLQAMTRGALLVKLFGRPGEESVAFSGRAGRVRDIGVRIAMANRIFFTALALVAALATALVYGIGGNLAISGVISVGTLLALAALLTRLYGPLTALSNVRVDVMTALVSFERVFEVLDLEPMVKDRAGAIPIATGPSTITFDHVRFRYPSAEEVSLASLEGVARPDAPPSSDVLRDVSFTAQPGQMVALVGPSGAGKTTITSLVSRLYDVTGGSVVINGSDVRDVTLDSLHALIGVVTQDAHMFHETIRGNLQYANPNATDDEIMGALADAQVLDLVQSLPEGLDTVVGDRGYRLSGGEKQRMAIARLLLKAPDVVVLDEATAHLDSESEAAVQRALATALKGRTSLVIAHRLSTIREADQILVIDDGRVVQSGTHDALLAEGGLYRDLYQTQFKGQADDAVGSLTR